MRTPYELCISALGFGFTKQLGGDAPKLADVVHELKFLLGAAVQQMDYNRIRAENLGQGADEVRRELGGGFGGCNELIEPCQANRLLEFLR